MTDQISFTPERAVENAVLSGAQARFYETGTLTPVTVYSDAAGMAPATSLRQMTARSGPSILAP